MKFYIQDTIKTPYSSLVSWIMSLSESDSCSQLSYQSKWDNIGFNMPFLLLAGVVNKKIKLQTRFINKNYLEKTGCASEISFTFLAMLGFHMNLF